jgi:hypothetical protein
MKVISLVSLVGIIVFSGCSSPGMKKLIIDSSGDKPDWVKTGKLSWEKDNLIYFKSKQTVRADQRVNGCYVVASNDNKELMLQGIASDMKGATDEAQTDLNENAELILGKVRSGKWEGKLYGFKDDEQYFERYQIKDEATGEKSERVDCYVLSLVNKKDYNKTKQEIVNKVVAVDPRIREAITKKQVDFFSDKKAVSSTSEGQ